MNDPIHEQRVLSFAQAQHSAADIDAMRRQRMVLQAEVEDLARRHKESAEYTDLQEAKKALQSVEEQIAQATDQLVDGLANGGK